METGPTCRCRQRFISSYERSEEGSRPETSPICFLQRCCLTLWVTPAFCAILLFLLFHYCHTLIPSYPCNLLQLHNAQYSFMSIYKFLFILISTRESKSNDLSARVISGIALSALEYCIPVLYMTGLHPSVTQ